MLSLSLCIYITTFIHFSCSCYANAVLQCLTFTRPITSYLLQRLHSETCKYRFMIHSGCLVVWVPITLFLITTFFTIIQVGSGTHALYASLNGWSDRDKKQILLYPLLDYCRKYSRLEERKMHTSSWGQYLMQVLFLFEYFVMNKLTIIMFMLYQKCGRQNAICMPWESWCFRVICWRFYPYGSNFWRIPTIQGLSSCFVIHFRLEFYLVRSVSMCLLTAVAWTC